MQVKNAVIGGSMADYLLKNKKIIGERLGEILTPFGKSQPIYKVKREAVEILFLCRHGDEGYQLNASSVNYQANIYALKDLGVERILAWSGPGAINPQLSIGDYVIPDDIIDETKIRESTFYLGTGIGFIRQEWIFCPQLSKILGECLKELGYRYKKGGVYVCTEGPRLETKAEIKKFKSYGGDMVGMTLVPEVFLAKELEMCYVALCYITNYAEGVRKSAFTSGELFNGLITPSEKRLIEETVLAFPEIITYFYNKLETIPRLCNCKESMKRYKVEKRIGEDWHEWIKK
jgi:5'-methylthioadenosine phosphorylase